MIKLNPVKSSSTTRITGSKKNDASKGTFRVPDEPFASEAASIASTSSVGALASLMDLQEISDQTLQRRRLKERGQDLLDELDKLRIDLLRGAFSTAHLKELANTLQQSRELFDDSQLSTVVLEIEQRVAVELAKLEMAQKT